MKSLLSILFFFCFLFSQGQAAYKQGDIVNNFSAKNILNYKQKTADLNSLKNKITIIDFFGTWCLPCRKALPILASIQKKHPAQLSVLLISIEKEAQLNKFISNQQDFTFPIIVDENNTITNLFQPPAYPYTIVLDKNNRIIVITEAALITDEKINEWLTEKETLPIKEKNANIVSATAKQKNMVIQNSNPLNELSQQFIYAAKTNDETETANLVAKLKTINIDSLKTQLKTDDEKKAFWINIYNGYTQLLLRKDPDKYKDRSAFFKAKQIDIAEREFSLDEIEHDILRHSKVKWSLGYFNKLFPKKIDKALRVKKLDYRIHFALNCGAKSCPPIAFYQPETLQTQLDVATKAYLTGEAEYDSEKNLLALPSILGWFRHDFKGKKNMLLLTKKLNIVPEDKYPKIVFKKYDWNLYLDNYKY